MYITGSTQLSGVQVERAIAAVEILTGEYLDTKNTDDFVIDKYDSAPEIDCYNNYSKDGVTAYSTSYQQTIQAEPAAIPETEVEINAKDGADSDIKARNQWLDPLKKELQAIYRRVYGQRAEESKRHADPQNYTWRRYFDPKAPHYVGNDLSDWEKDFCWAKERTMLVYDGMFIGHNGFTSGDPILEGRGLGRSDPSIPHTEPYHWQWSSAGFRFHNRNMVTSQLNGLLSRNGIFLPENMRLSFVIDSQYRLRVTGTDDENLTEHIENLINANGNSEQLYKHILQSTRTRGSEQISSQIKENSLRMYRVDDIIRTYTDYTRQDLNLVDGKFLTPDGMDIFELIKAGIVKEVTSGAGILIEHNRQELAWLAKVGPENIPDMVLTIDYENGNLYDVGQPYGYGPGQTGWIIDLLWGNDPNKVNPLLLQ
jgi:hypothetical protein